MYVNHNKRAKRRQMTGTHNPMSASIAMDKTENLSLALLSSSSLLPSSSLLLHVALRPSLLLPSKLPINHSSLLSPLFFHHTPYSSRTLYENNLISHPDTSKRISSRSRFMEGPEGPLPPPATSRNSIHYSKSRVMSSEIVEIVELEENTSSLNGGGSCSGIDGNGDIYVAVGRDDLDAVKWAVDHISPGARLFLVHVFPPIHYISTPVGRLSKNQLSKDQLRFYIKEENNRRRNLLQKYIRLCDNAKVPVDTMLLESSEIGKAIVELIPVLNITNLVLGTKLLQRPRRLMKKVGKAEYVKKNAPDYCQVTVVHQGKTIDLLHWEENRKQLSGGGGGGARNTRSASSSRIRRVASMASPDRKFFQCACFSAKFD